MSEIIDSVGVLGTVLCVALAAYALIHKPRKKTKLLDSAWVIWWMRTKR